MTATKKKIDELVKRLRAASVAYYETAAPTMTDAEYDALLEQLQNVAPNHPYLQEIGAPPGSSVVRLPVGMPSLDKRKPDTLRQEDLSEGPYVSMDKLDGISALWVCGYQNKPALYLRGNGTEGQDVSHCISGIQGLKQTTGPSLMVRGELIVPKGIIQGTLARNWVNGVLHQKTPSKEDLSKIHFVAYQVFEPSTFTRGQQMKWLQIQGFEVAWSHVLKSLTIDVLKELFQSRRQESIYECDGIVIGKDCIPLLSARTNPKDAYAFKMATDDQRAITKVLEVEWQSSRTGNWIPRIRFEPVKIGTATIEYCTGFNGQFIKEHTIGPDAIILVRRSGDVIPVCEKVVTPCPTGWFPPPEGRWAWDATAVQCLDTTLESTPEKLALEMAHQLVSLGVEGFSKTSTKKLVDAGIKTLLDLYNTPEDKVKNLIGAVNGTKLKTGLSTAGTTAKESQWIRAFLGWPKGFGETKIEKALEKEPSIEKWPTLMTPPTGQTMATFKEIQKAVPAYLEWRTMFPMAIPKMNQTENQVQPKPQVAVKGFYGMSGFRDAILQERLATSGWVLQDRVTKSTSMLLVPDDAKETTKVKAAREAGIRIVLRSQVNGLF
jgi:DNA ligase (NAD+)